MGTLHKQSLPHRQGTRRRRFAHSMSETPSILLAGLWHVAGNLHRRKYRRAGRCRRCPITRVSTRADNRLQCTFPTCCTKSIASNDLRRTPWHDGGGRRGGRWTQALCTIAGELIWLQNKSSNVGGRSIFETGGYFPIVSQDPPPAHYPHLHAYVHARVLPLFFIFF
jgi:hypothetical protein